MRPFNAVRTVWDAEAIDTSQLGFRPMQKIATIHASSGFIRGIPKGYKIVNRKFSTAVRPLLAAAAILCAVAPAKAAEKEPNIVFMLMDNLGYGELAVC
jgi:hypothetical protein